MKRIVIFASGSGTNAQNIAEYFNSSPKARVSIILSNNKNAYVLVRAKKLNIPTVCFTKEEFQGSNKVLGILQNENPDIIVLAGFLLKFPENIIRQFPDKIINIHPALLPKYGGKGMYGMRVHQAVIDNQEKETGITIHYVNKDYDKGAIIFQKSILVSKKDTPESIAQKVHALEYDHFPKVIEKLLMSEKG